MPIARALRGLRLRPAGWATLVLAVAGWGLGGPLRWTELRSLGAGATLTLLVALVVVLLPVRATARVTAQPAHTTVDHVTSIEVEVRARVLPVPTPLVRIEGDVGSQVLRLRTLWPWRARVERVEHVAARRGVFTLGPLRHVRSDPLGLVQRTRPWGETSTLWVRPRVVIPESFAQGGVLDLEGLPSDQMSTSDLAFHALREYVPGDDLRRVHWRSSAKAATLLVRQYHESRSMHAAVVVDDDPASYADEEEFETAISVGASLAIRALTDGFDVDLGCGPRVGEPAGREALLDETCRWVLAPAGAQVPLLARTTHVARTGPPAGIGVVVSGSGRDVDRLVEAGAAFGDHALRIAVRVDARAVGGVRAAHGVRVLEIARLADLPRLASWVTA